MTTSEHERYTLAELERIPTINSGWTADLKVDNGKIRVWLERIGITDGVPFEHTVCVEHLSPAGRWELVEQYNADDNSEVIPA